MHLFIAIKTIKEKTIGARNILEFWHKSTLRKWCIPCQKELDARNSLEVIFCKAAISKRGMPRILAF